MFGEMKKLFRRIGNGGRYALLMLLRSPVSCAMTAIHALFLQYAFNAVQMGDGGALTGICLLFGVASLGLFLYNGSIWSGLAAPLTTRMEGGLRETLLRKVCGLPLEKMESLPRGEWVTRLNLDVQAPFTEALPNGVAALVNLTVSAVVLWVLEPAVFGLVALFVIPHILCSQLLIARAMPTLGKFTLEATARNTGDLAALVECADVALLYDGKAYLLRRFEESSKGVFKAKMKICLRNALGAGILPLFGLGGYVVLLAVGAGWIASGALTFGDLTAAFQFRGGVLLGALNLIRCIVTYKENLAGVRRLNRTLEL